MMQYPFTTEKGETILDDRFLLENIRRNCGDNVGRFVEELLVATGFSQSRIGQLREIKETLDMIDFSNIEWLINACKENLKKLMLE